MIKELPPQVPTPEDRFEALLVEDEKSLFFIRSFPIAVLSPPGRIIPQISISLEVRTSCTSTPQRESARQCSRTPLVMPILRFFFSDHRHCQELRGSTNRIKKKVKQVSRVLWSGTCFWMKLNGKNWLRFMFQPLHSSIIEIGKPDIEKIGGACDRLLQNHDFD